MNKTNAFGNLLKALILLLPAFLLGLATDPLLNLVPWLGTWAMVAVLLVSLVAAAFLGALASSRLIPRRFATEVFPIDQKCHLAVVEHKHYRMCVPPARRLGIFEPPHAAVVDILERQLGLASGTYTFWPAFDWSGHNFQNVKRVQPPYCVQIEQRKHRFGIREHYDFIYVVKVSGERPSLHSGLNPQWKSIQELEEDCRLKEDMRPFPDVLTTFQEIVSTIKNSTAKSAGGDDDI